MEWIIGIIIIWFVWRLLTGKDRREVTLKDAIGRAYVASSRLNQNWIDTPIYWEAAERFAQDRNAQMSYGDSPSANFKMMINGKEVFVTLLKNSINGTTSISARNQEDIIKDGESFINGLMNKH